MSKQIILHRGEKFSQQGSGLFGKDVIHVGKWFHPVTKQAVEFSPERVEKHRLNLTRYLEAGNKVPMRDGHRNSTLARIGSWPGPAIKHQDKLIVMAEPTDPKAKDGMRNGSIDSVSVVIEFDLTDSKGNHYDEVITAIDCTDFPVLTGQGGFQELARDSQGNPLDCFIPQELSGLLPEGDKSIPQEEDMTMKEVALALGLPEAASDADVLKAAVAARKANEDVKAAQEGVKSAETKLSKVVEQLPAHGFELKGEKLSRVAVLELDVTEKEGDSEEVKALKKEIAAKRKGDALSSAKATKELVTKMSKDMNLPPALAGIAEEVLSATVSANGELNALMLSTDGKEVSMKKVEDMPGKLLKLVTGIVNLKGTKLSQQATETDEAAQRKALAKKVVAQVEGKKEEPAAK